MYFIIMRTAIKLITIYVGWLEQSKRTQNQELITDELIYATLNLDLKRRRTTTKVRENHTRVWVKS